MSSVSSWPGGCPSIHKIFVWLAHPNSCVSHGRLMLWQMKPVLDSLKAANYVPWAAEDQETVWIHYTTPSFSWLQACCSNAPGLYIWTRMSKHCSYWIYFMEDEHVALSVSQGCCGVIPLAHYKRSVLGNNGFVGILIISVLLSRYDNNHNYMKGVMNIRKTIQKKVYTYYTPRCNLKDLHK